MTGREGTGGVLLAHVQTSEELDPEMGVDHVVHVLPVGGHRSGGAELAVELDAVLAEDVPGDPHLASVPGLDHDVVVAASLLQPTIVLVPAVPLLTVAVILQQDHDVPLGENDISVVKVLSDCVSRHFLMLEASS